MVALTSKFGFGEVSRRLGLPMGLRSSEEKRVALDTIESILMALRREHDADYALHQLIQALENTQAQLLASLLDERAPDLTRATLDSGRPQALERRQLLRRTGGERRKPRKGSRRLLRKGTDRRAGTDRRQRTRRASLDAG